MLGIWLKFSALIFATAHFSAQNAAHAEPSFPQRLTLIGGITSAVITDGLVGKTRRTFVRFDSQGDSKGAVLLLPGFGLSSLIYTETPDGRDGWAQSLAAEGYTVYAYNGPRLQVHGGAVVDGRVWQKEQIWRRWGIGSKYPTPIAIHLSRPNTWRLSSIAFRW